MHHLIQEEVLRRCSEKEEEKCSKKEKIIKRTAFVKTGAVDFIIVRHRNGGDKHGERNRKSDCRSIKRPITILQLKKRLKQESCCKEQRSSRYGTVKYNCAMHSCSSEIMKHGSQTCISVRMNKETVLTMILYVRGNYCSTKNRLRH